MGSGGRTSQRLNGSRRIELAELYSSFREILGCSVNAIRQPRDDCPHRPEAAKSVLIRHVAPPHNESGGNENGQTETWTRTEPCGDRTAAGTARAESKTTRLQKRLWERVLTDKERDKLGGDFQKNCNGLGTYGMLTRLGFSETGSLGLFEIA